MDHFGEIPKNHVISTPTPDEDPSSQGSPIDAAENKAVPKPGFTDHEPQSLLEKLLPGVDTSIRDLFEIVSGGVHIKPIEQLALENDNIPVGLMQQKTQAATNARLLIEYPVKYLPLEDREKRELEIKQYLSSACSDWPAPLLSALLRDPDATKIDDLGIRLVCNKYGLDQFVKRNGAMIISPRFAHPIIPTVDFDKKDFGIDPDLDETNSDQLKKRLEFLFSTLVPARR